MGIARILCHHDRISYIFYYYDVMIMIFLLLFVFSGPPAFQLQYVHLWFLTFRNVN